MVTRAFAILGVGDAAEPRAKAILATLDALTDEGEPVLSAYRTEQDGPWLIDILFTATDDEDQRRWLDVARSLLPDLPEFQTDPLAERDWVAEGQKALHPVRAGRFLVHGSHDSARLSPSRWRITIDAGRAFGTAHHASTCGCLLALERLAKRGPLGTVHDVGTGSGILAIAAERLGATDISGGDIDPVAVRVAIENVKANRTHRPIRLRTASGPFEAADVVIANILARPLIKMAPALSAACGSWLILSGLRRSDRRRVEAAFQARGLVTENRIVVEDWVTITMRQRFGPNQLAGRRLTRSPRPFILED